MRTECEECGEYKLCNEEDVCYDCIQDQQDLEDWELEAELLDRENEADERRKS